MLTLVTGGIRSGKSAFAEGLLTDMEVCYIATGLATDQEMDRRIEKHRSRRPSEWRTFEAYENIVRALGPEEYYLLDDVGGLVSNQLYKHTESFEDLSDDKVDMAQARIFYELDSLVEEALVQNKSLVLVSSEVGLGSIAFEKVTRVFTDVLGLANQRLAREAERVYFCISGIGQRIK